MKFELPFLPPSVNTAYYTDFKSGTRHKSKKYREFKKDLEAFLPKGEVKGEIQVEYNFYMPDKRRRDVANYEKVLTDCLVSYGVIEEDSLIQRMVLEKYFDKGMPATVIQITKI